MNCTAKFCNLVHVLFMGFDIFLLGFVGYFVILSQVQTKDEFLLTVQHIPHGKNVPRVDLDLLFSFSIDSFKYFF